MADTFVRSPRYVDTIIRLHPAEVADAVCQQAMLAAMTDAELKRIADAVQKEQEARLTHQPTE